MKIHIYEVELHPWQEKMIEETIRKFDLANLRSSMFYWHRQGRKYAHKRDDAIEDPAFRAHHRKNNPKKSLRDKR